MTFLKTYFSTALMTAMGCSSQTASTGSSVEEEPTSTTTVSIDGVAMTVTDIELQPPAEHNDQRFDLFISFEGSSMPAGSDLHLLIGSVGTGCDSGNEVWLRPGIDSPTYSDQYTSSRASCGLTVSSVPAELGDTLAGTIEGSLDALQTWTEPRQVSVSVAFSAPWEQEL